MIKIDNEEFSECFFRVLFDGLSSEYQSTPIEEKIKLLQKMVDNGLSLKIVALKMHDFCNNKAKKDIRLIDIIFGLSDLIEGILKSKVS
jgi:hypothetical protein